MLKEWLVRRRDNPYPTREEKKLLAQETGLTYTQICNWFANWRRKLKNSKREPSKKSWGHLIKNYNTNAKGNVEQFSICSNDSIWGDDEHSSQLSDSGSYSCSNLEPPERQNEYSTAYSNSNMEFCNHRVSEQNGQYLNEFYADSGGSCSGPGPHYYAWTSQPQCFQISSTTDEKFSVMDEESLKYQQNPSSNPKYKQQIMEKYLRDTNQGTSISPSPELSKWLESAANFTPNKHNYIDWNSNRPKPEKHRSKSSQDYTHSIATIHQKEELDAAEALATLACNYRQRLLNSTA
ncbi:iroquois-class homeodomain protein IRX-5 isoform X2 [Hermetia illucens]|nr:iroquois-class homeodomain protein IRX-5 isoform X2 [Hermetia illucens]